MTIQDQYTSAFAKTQESWAGVLESFTENAQSVFGKLGATASPVDPNSAIDQVFDFWEKTLGAQREVAKQLIGATVAAGEQVKTQAESLGAAVKDQAESMQRTAKRTAAKS